jgi:hypothetical protein
MNAFDTIENDLVCPKCGYYAEYIDCDACGGEGYFEVYDDDPLWYDPGDTELCHQCAGKGGWHVCPNKYCEQGIV